MGQAQVMPQLMNDHSAQPVMKCRNIDCLQAMIAHYTGTAGLVAEAKLTNYQWICLDNNFLIMDTRQPISNLFNLHPV